MRLLPGLLLVAILPAVAADPPTDTPPSAREGYDTPFFVVPYAAAKPVIDGVIGDDEWRGALSVRALQTIKGQVSVRQARFFLSWDEETIYLAMRSPFRTGERPVQKHRDRDGDQPTIWDDSYEVWFDVGARMEGGLELYTQYLGNFAGAKYDAAYLPTIGLRRLSYEAGWQPANRLVDAPAGRVWEMEVAIPRASIHVDQPFADGFALRACLARNYKRPWEQNSIESGGFQKPAQYARYELRKDAPALHLAGVADPRGGTVGLRLSANAAAARQLRWTFDSDSGLGRSGVLDLVPGAAAEAAPGLDLEGVHTGKASPKEFFRIRVTDPDSDALLLDWCSQRVIGAGSADATILDQEFEDDLGDQVALSLVLNPVADYLRVTGDFINFDARDSIERVEVDVVDGGGQRVASRTLTLGDLAYVRGTLELPGLQPGSYTSRLRAIGRTGENVLEREEAFEKKDPATEYDWWDTPHGNIEQVISPWTPVTWEAPRIGVWGRTMEVGAAGLPAALSSAGLGLLAAPCSLVAELAGGETVTVGPAALKALSAADHRAVIEARSSLGDLRVTSRVTAEFDGMYKVEMTLTPAQPVAVQSLKVVIPFANGVADHLHACGAGIRWGYAFEFIPPAKRGRLWDSRSVDGQPMKVGSFIPYVWIGNPKGGLCWFADTDCGWSPNDAVPALEVRRDGEQSTDLVLNLVGSPLTIDAPRTIDFAFLATPVKPLFKGWRVDTWNTSDTFAEFQCAEKVGSNRMLSPVPWTFDIEKCRKLVKQRQESSHPYVWGINKYRQWAVPYGRHNELFPRHMPEAKYFGEHWQSKGNWHLYYTKTLNDYMCHKLAEWIEQCDIDGYYSDNVRPEACSNVEAGRGYYLPDGRVQPEYNMFGLRRYFLRLRAVFAEHGKHDKIVTHMTHNMIIPWLGACDIAFDGEDHVIGPTDPRSFMDWWTLDRMRLDNPHQWGVVVKFMSEFENIKTWPDEAAYGKTHRAYVGQVLLHDALPFDRTSFAARDRFGIGVDGVQFLGFWDDGNGVSCTGQELYASAWLRPGKLLVLAVNRGRRSAEAEVRIDWEKLGLSRPRDWNVVDMEHIATYARFGGDGTEPLAVHELGARPVTFREDGTLVVTVDRQDYRLIAVETRADGGR